MLWSGPHAVSPERPNSPLAEVREYSLSPPPNVIRDFRTSTTMYCPLSAAPRQARDGTCHPTSARFARGGYVRGQPIAKTWFANGLASASTVIVPFQFSTAESHIRYVRKAYRPAFGHESRRNEPCTMCNLASGERSVAARKPDALPNRERTHLCGIEKALSKAT